VTRLFSYTIPIDDGGAPNPRHVHARDMQAVDPAHGGAGRLGRGAVLG
jgi:hypothetical protein